MSLIPLNSTLLERLRSMKVEESEEKEKKTKAGGPIYGNPLRSYGPLPPRR